MAMSFEEVLRALSGQLQEDSAKRRASIPAEAGRAAAAAPAPRGAEEVVTGGMSAITPRELPSDQEATARNFAMTQSQANGSSADELANYLRAQRVLREGGGTVQANPGTGALPAVSRDLSPPPAASLGDYGSGLEPRDMTNQAPIVLPEMTISSNPEKDRRLAELDAAQAGAIAAMNPRGRPAPAGLAQELEAASAAATAYPQSPVYPPAAAQIPQANPGDLAFQQYLQNLRMAQR